MHPGRVEAFNHGKSGAILPMRIRQIARADEKFAHDFRPRKFKVGAKQLHPIRQFRRVVVVQPGLEGALLGLNFDYSPGIHNRRIHF